MLSNCLRGVLWSAALLGGLLAGPVAYAQTALEPPAQKHLNPDQREQAREKLRSRWQAMTPQERDEAKVKLKQRFESLSPEQKNKLRERWQQRRANTAAP